MITKEDFIKHVGREPEYDDLERCNCADAGSRSHLFCGWCNEHQLPVYECGCVKVKE